MYWGLTPALDLISQHEANLACDSLPDELNILIMGGSDARHVLQTLAKRYRHTKVKLNFYITEACVESFAKQLLLLYTAFQSSVNMALVQKTRTFMELYGNSLLRPAVAKYLRNTGCELVKFITNFDNMHEVLPFLDIDLKYKERDNVENIFKFWCADDEFNICDYWDRRLRKTLGVRYDSKMGAFDWDLHMRFRPMGGDQVCSQEYRNFRLNGIAFTWLESDVSKTNRSLVCAVVPNGESFAHYGYLGDMQTGPFVAYGLDCEDKAFTKRTHGQNTYRSTDVTERNLRQIFSELEFGTEYEHQPTGEAVFGTIVTKLSEVKVIDIKDSGGKTSNPCLRNKCIPLEDARINFVSLDLVKRKSKYHGLFDVIYVNGAYLKHLDKEFVRKIMNKDRSLLMVENPRYVLSYREKDLKEHYDNVKEKLQGLLLEEKGFSCEKDDYLTFVVKSDV